MKFIESAVVARLCDRLGSTSRVQPRCPAAVRAQFYSGGSTMLAVAIALLTILLSARAGAAEFACVQGRRVAHELPLSVRNHPRFDEQCLIVRMTGPIVSGDDAKLKQLLRKRALIYLLLDSPGGNVATSMQIGYIVRQSYVSTIVDDDANCASACFFVWAAGIFRSGNPQIHRPSIADTEFAKQSAGDSLAFYSAIEQKVEKYLTEVGMLGKLPRTFIATMFSIPPHDVRPLSSIGGDPSVIYGKFEPAIEQLLIARCGPGFRENTICIRAVILAEALPQQVD